MWIYEKQEHAKVAYQK